jgi:hypothetical protein
MFAGLRRRRHVFVAGRRRAGGHQEERSDGRNAVGDVGDTASDNVSTTCQKVLQNDVGDRGTGT